MLRRIKGGRIVLPNSLIAAPQVVASPAQEKAILDAHIKRLEKAITNAASEIATLKAEKVRLQAQIKYLEQQASTKKHSKQSGSPVFFASSIPAQRNANVRREFEFSPQ